MTNIASLPYFTSGPIVKGFGRGSQALGIPTANFPEDVVAGLPDDFATGIYYGWAEIDGDIYKMVMSIGWNPFFKNEKKSMETHILHKFPGSLHGKELRIVITGYIRPEKDFSSIEALIEAINNDISIADRSLDEPAMLQYKEHTFFKQRKRPTGSTFPVGQSVMALSGVTIFMTSLRNYLTSYICSPENYPNDIPRPKVDFRTSQNVIKNLVTDRVWQNVFWLSVYYTFKQFYEKLLARMRFPDR